MNRLRSEKYTYRDRDYVETVDGWLFGVVSDIHPDGRVLAYLKYVPGEGGWSREGVTYKRVLTSYTLRDLAQTLEMVRRLRPQYIFHDPATDEDFTYIPVESIKNHYRCEKRLGEILEKPVGRLEKTCSRLVRKLSTCSGVGKEWFGVSGSLLLKLYNPAADIDLIVYGGENFKRVVAASREIETTQNIKHIRDILVKNYMAKYPITLADAELLAERCLTRGIFEGAYYSLHAVKTLEEIKVEYGMRRYRAVGVRRAKLRITDVSESIFTPAYYQVEDMENKGDAVEALLCYDTTFAGLFREGDIVEAVGKLERVEDVKGLSYYSLLIGSVKTAGIEYVRLLKTS